MTQEMSIEVKHISIVVEENHAVYRGMYNQKKNQEDARKGHY
ncbi:MAG: hypothetical protein RIQ62_188 [Bacteroidota bacterium]